MNRTSVALAISIAATAALAGCTVGASEGDYPLYSSLQEACSAADIVAVVTVSGSDVREVDISMPTGDTPEENPSFGTSVASGAPEPLLVVEMVSTVTVETSLKGAVHAGDSIEIGQPDGSFNGVRYESDRYDLKTGGRYVVFLETVEGAVPANSLINAQQGPYAIDSAGRLVPAAGNTLVESRASDDLLTLCAQ